MQISCELRLIFQQKLTNFHLIHRLESSKLNSNYRFKEKLLKLIRYFGRLYDADLEGIDEFGTFQDILDTVDSNKTTGVFNSKAKLELLAPKCSDYIMKCKWGGEFMNCDDIIEFRRTNEGDLKNFFNLFEK
jgi:hypothetical protein